MKLAVSLVVLLLALIGAPVLWQYLHFDPHSVPTSGLPWQIERLAGGDTRVFGLTLGKSPLADAQARFGPEMQLAVIATPDETGNVEGYYESVTAGFIAGKLILTAELSPAAIAAMRERAPKTEYMQSTTRKAKLAEADIAAALAAPIRAIAFIPGAQLDEAVILERFGAPAERIRVNEHLEHLLYPEQGLDLVLDSKGRELLQYVAPSRFAALRAPLLAQAQAQAKP